MASNDSLRNQPPTPLSHDDISRRARELWESRGQPSGQDDAIWLEAERELSRSAGDAATPSRSTGSSPARRAGAPRATGRMNRRDADIAPSRGAETSARDNAINEPDRDI